VYRLASRAEPHYRAREVTEPSLARLAIPPSLTEPSPAGRGTARLPPKYMPSLQPERFWHPIHVMSWPSEERWSLAEGQLSGLSSLC
jgi:hypothetical protein